MEAIKKILRTPSAFALLLVAIVTLIGVIIKSNTDKAIARMPIDATSTAEARLTEIANFADMTQSAIVSSATWTPSPIATKRPTSTFTATSDVTSDVLLQDDFIDNRNGWLLQHESGIKSDIIGGKYKFTITCPQTYETFYCGNYIMVPDLSSKDLQLELDATMKNISPSAEVMIAFQFRVNASNYYTVYFRSISKYTVSRSYNGSLGKLLEDTTIPSFSPNTDTVNRYGFSATDTFLQPLFNGQELQSVEDGFINQAGLVYIAIFVSRGGSATVELDNFIAMDKSK